MNKEHVIDEIRRTAKANGGVALGWRRFEEVTGIRYYDWYGQLWTRWGDAVREAGFEPNRMSAAYDDGFLLEQLVVLTRRLGRVPIQGDLLLASKGDSTFPSEKVFRRFGSKPQRVSRVIAFCEANPGRATGHQNRLLRGHGSIPFKRVKAMGQVRSPAARTACIG